MGLGSTALLSTSRENVRKVGFFGKKLKKQKMGLTLFYTGGVSSWPPLEGYLAWRLSGCSDWAHISWLCFFQHLLCPIEAIFQKKILKFWKTEIFFFDRSDIKGSPLWNFFFQNYFFSNKSYFFNLNLHFTCSELSFEVYNMSFGENFQIFIFYYRIPINNQVLSATSHG